MFSSMHICRGSSQSRRDDIESILYIMVYMLKKHLLPWSKFQTTGYKRAKIRQLRSETSMEKEFEEMLPTPEL